MVRLKLLPGLLAVDLALAAPPRTSCVAFKEHERTA
jgi:hypothetical protein